MLVCWVSVEYFDAQVFELYFHGWSRMQLQGNDAFGTGELLVAIIHLTHNYVIDT